MAGDRDQAFRWLEEALATNEKMVAGYVNGDRDLDSLRSDPRFDAIRDEVRRLKLEKHKEK